MLLTHLKEPEPRRLVNASGDNPAVIRADRHRIDLALVAAQNHGVGIFRVIGGATP